MAQRCRHILLLRQLHYTRCIDSKARESMYWGNMRIAICMLPLGQEYIKQRFANYIEQSASADGVLLNLFRQLYSHIVI